MKGMAKGWKKKAPVLVGLAVAGLIGAGMLSSVWLTGAQAAEEKAAPAPALQGLPGKATPEDLAAGKAVYFRKCVWCHGPEGAGDGPGADRLWPRPRNFNQGTFKIRHTASGELPTLNDLILTVTNGLPGSAMPSWEGILTATQIRQVVEFVRTDLVKDRDFTDKETETLTVISYGKQIPSSKESIERGKEVFMNKGKCVECHGPDARGDGNATQKDEWGFPIRPADLHKCWNFRGNRRDPYNPANIFREVSTGLNGTPMPSFAETLSEEQRWDVANFIIDLCPKKQLDTQTTKPMNDFVVRAKFVEGEIPGNPDDPKWQERAPNYIGLGGQITHKPRNFVRQVDDVWVRAMYNGTDIAFLLEWDDRNKSVGTPETLAKQASYEETPPEGHPIALRENPEFMDAAAIEFPMKWESLNAPEKPRFIFGDAKNGVDLWKWEVDGKVGSFTGTGWDQELAPHGKGEVTTPFAEHKDGRWRVIFKRPMLTDDKEKAAQFVTGKYVPTLFMVWDGHNGDAGRKMSISSWYHTILEPPIPTKAYIYPVVAAVFMIGLQFWVVSKVKKGKKK